MVKVTEKAAIEMKKLLRWTLKFAFICAILILSLLVFKVIADHRFFNSYDSKAPLNVQILSEKTQDGMSSLESTFEGIDGITVPLISFFPDKTTDSPLPCVIFLHGIGQSKSFLKRIAPYFTEHGYAIVCFDQYTRGERRLPRDTGPVKKILSLRQRAALTVMETRRLVDYLQNNPKIAPDRIYLVGASYGSMMGTIASAQEPRIAGTALLYGGGDLKRFGESEIIRNELGSWTPFAAAVGAFVMAPADPVLYIGKITPPRPLLIQNGKRDSIIPVAAAEALIRAAGNHAEVIWYDSDHIGLDMEQTKLILNDVLSWLDRVDE